MLARPLSLVVWLLGLGATAVAAAFALRWIGVTVVDRDQQHAMLRALAAGDLASAFDTAPMQQTSGPGLGIVGVLLYLPLEHLRSPAQAWDLVSYACLLPLGVATVAASRAVGVAARSGRELVNVAAVVLGIPTLACYVEAFHPADVLAVAAVLGAVAALARRHLLGAAVLLGFAVATKQWAVVAVLVLAALVDRDDRSKLLLGSIATAVVLVVPFILAAPDTTISALVARDVVRGDLTAASLLPLHDGVRFLFARYLPLLLVVGWCAVLIRRQVRFAPEVALAALAVGLLVRPLVDPAGYLYYLAPGYAAAVLLAPASLRWPVGGVLGGALLWGRRALRTRFPSAVILEVQPDHAARAVGVGLSVVATAAIAVAAVLAARRTLALAVRSSGSVGSAS